MKNDVPGTLYRRGDIWWFERNTFGHRLRVSTKMRDREAAVQWVRSGAFGTRTFSQPKDIPPRFVKTLLNNARTRAKALHVPFRLTVEDFQELYEQAGKHCAVSGLPFDVAQTDGVNRRPYAPSVDRVDRMLGYTKDNCRIVCCAVNLAMNEFGENVLWDIATSMVETRRRKLQGASRTHTGTHKGR
jgi:hypothetical protein